MQLPIIIVIVGVPDASLQTATSIPTAGFPTTDARLPNEPAASTPSCRFQNKSPAHTNEPRFEHNIYIDFLSDTIRIRCIS